MRMPVPFLQLYTDGYTKKINNDQHSNLHKDINGCLKW